MDISTVKQKAFTDASVEGKKNHSMTLGSLSVTFEYLLSKAGKHIGGSLNSIAGQNGIGQIADRAEQPAPAQKQKFDYNDDAPRIEQREDHASDNNREHDDVKASGNGDAVKRNDSASHDNDKNNNVAASNVDDNVAPEDTSTKNNQAAVEDKSAGKETQNHNDDDSTVAVQGTDKTQVVHSAEKADDVFVGLVAAAQNVTIAGDVSGQSNKNNGEKSQRVNGVAGLSKAVGADDAKGLSKGGEHAGDDNVNEQQVKANDGGQRPKANVGTNSQASTAANANKNVNTHLLGQGSEQTQAKEQLQVNAKVETSGNSSNTTAQQTELAKMVGEGNRLAVSVNVADKTSNMVSKPGSTLSAAAILAADDGSQKQSARPLTLNNGTASMNPVNGNDVVVQNQAQQASAQTQSISASAGEAKASVQGVQVANTGGQQTQAASGENLSATATNATNETTETLKNTATQANKAQQVNVPKHTVVDQVSVQITKAMKAGMDKINIQLRPDDLGRVDVRLEVGHDGRTQAVVLADNKSTMELLQRNANELQQALQNAGLQLGNDGLNFGLRGQNDGNANGDNGANGTPMDDMAEDQDDMTQNAISAAYDGGIREDGRVDVRA